MTNLYPRLPTIDAPRPHETLHGYGVRVLAFVLTEGCTATLSDHDLALADHVYPVAVGHPEILPCAVDKLSAARHKVLSAIAWRKAWAEGPTAATGRALPPYAPDEGPMAKLIPLPKINPPAVAYGRPDIQF